MIVKAGHPTAVLRKMANIEVTTGKWQSVLDKLELCLFALTP